MLNLGPLGTVTYFDEGYSAFVPVSSIIFALAYAFYYPQRLNNV
jgi:hypothetical protein